jgi:hypothetical protein
MVKLEKGPDDRGACQDAVSATTSSASTTCAKPSCPPSSRVKPQIAQQLQQQKLAKYQDELRGKAKVE